jgi:hypothetical protein
MPKYTCERCLKEFSQKSHFDKHLNKKIPCQDNKGKIEEVVENILINKKLILNNTENIITTMSNNMSQKDNCKKQLTFIEVCAGAGGLSKGFIDCGFQALLLILRRNS